ncbi:hypothetical protein L1987_83552 [Smallanthus sonchifolius]|uniref:Uncharacterized protein n=1 Tax=Smallanthus sonchifolius TaxID=185202 RepID=A0ACB8YC97_9ASTR|nr:hypothetical protein L1987_83552 [Smallanthus sonchifolius]
MAVAEIFLTPFITVLFDKLASADLISLARSSGIYYQINRWKKSLSQIQSVLADAGHKQISERAVQMWLHDLHDLAYDIDDVLDDLATEAMRRKLNKKSETSKVLKIIPTYCIDFTPHNIMYGRTMNSKLDEITTKLHNLAEQKNILGLNGGVEWVIRKTRKPEETSLVDESKILGHDADKHALVRMLLGDEICKQNVSILAEG